MELVWSARKMHPGDLCDASCHSAATSVFAAVYFCATGVSYLSLSLKSLVTHRCKPLKILLCDIQTNIWTDDFPRTSLSVCIKAALRCCVNVSACFHKLLCFILVPQAAESSCVGGRSVNQCANTGCYRVQSYLQSGSGT